MKLEINPESTAECQLAIRMLSAVVGAPFVEPAAVVAEQEPVANVAEAWPFKDIAEEAPVADKPKRGRPAKVKEYPVMTATEVLSRQTPQVQPLTIDDLRAALQRFTAAEGMPAGIDLLKGFDCARISELAEKDELTKFAFVAKCPAPVVEAA